MSKTIIGFQVDDEIREQLEEQARREDRSLSSLIRRLIDKYLKEQEANNGKDANA